jgi:hypothetical protein
VTSAASKLLLSQRVPLLLLERDGSGVLGSLQRLASLRDPRAHAAARHRDAAPCADVPPDIGRPVERDSPIVNQCAEAKRSPTRAALPTETAFL